MEPVAFNAVFTLFRLRFYGQLLEQLGVTLLSRPILFSQCYSLLLLFHGQINDDDDDDDDDHRQLRKWHD